MKKISNKFFIAGLLAGIFCGAADCEASSLKDSSWNVVRAFSNFNFNQMRWCGTENMDLGRHPETPKMEAALDGYKEHFVQNPKKAFKQLRKDLNAQGFDAKYIKRSLIDRIDEHQGNNDLESTVKKGFYAMTLACIKAAAGSVRKVKACNLYGREAAGLAGFSPEDFAQSMKEFEQEL